MYFERLWMLWFLFISVLLYLLIRRSWSYFASFEKSRQISNFLFKARVPDMNAYRKFLGETLLTLPGVQESTSYVVMEQVKETLNISIPY